MPKHKPMFTPQDIEQMKKNMIQFAKEGDIASKKLLESLQTENKPKKTNFLHKIVRLFKRVLGIS